MEFTAFGSTQSNTLIVNTNGGACGFEFLVGGRLRVGRGGWLQHGRAALGEEWRRARLHGNFEGVHSARSGWRKEMQAAAERQPQQRHFDLGAEPPAVSPAPCSSKKRRQTSWTRHRWNTA